MRGFGGMLAGVVLTSSTAWGTGVSGRVVGSDGQPVAGVTISAYAHEDQRSLTERWIAGRPRVPLATVSAGADGAFRLEGNGPFAFVEARAEGHAPTLAAVADDRPVTLTLRRVQMRRGVISARGKPVAGAVVVWASSEIAEVITRTGADGSYETPAAESLAAGLVVFHPAFAPLMAAPEERPTRDHELEPGVGLSGAVVDEAGRRPVADATLWIDGTWPLGRTDAQGRFHIPNAPAEWETVAARSGGRVGATGRKNGPLVITVKPGGSLAGTVRDERSGQPLAGAKVLASSDNPGFDPQVVTDARGQYAFGGLAAGRYRLSASRPGFASAPRDWRKAGWVDVRGAASLRRDLVLARLPVLSGRVEDEQHRPIEGAVVTLGFKEIPHIYTREPVWGMVETEEAFTRTAADGSFSLTVPSSEANPPASRQDRPLIVLKPGYAAGRVDRKDAAGAPSGPLVVRLIRGLELAGRVANGEGAPVAGVAITLAEEGTYAGTMLPTHLMLANLKDEGWTTSDASGRFSVRVHPVSHDLVFRKPGHAPRTVRGYDPRAGQGLEVVLDPAVVLRGRVSRADGRGVPSVEIGAASQPMSLHTETAITSAEGTFEIGGLAPGFYQLVATSEPLGIAKSLTVEAPATDVQIVLAPSGSLRGRVVDGSTRQPVPRFRIALTPEPDSGMTKREVPTEDPSGVFSIADVPVGNVDLEVSADGYAAKGMPGLSVSPDEQTPELEIALEAEVPIRGRVTRDGQRPLADAKVTVETQEAWSEALATSDEGGNYELRGVPPGDVKLRFEAKGFQVERRTLNTREATRMDVTLKPGLSLRGQVVRGEVGAPDVHVSAMSSAPDAGYQSAQTDERGQFTLEGLAPSRYTVSAFAEDGGRAEAKDVDVQRSGPLRLVLERPRTSILKGKVVGLPAAGDDPTMAVVTATSEQGQMGRAVVDGGHSFRMEGAPVGRVRVQASTQSMSGATRTSRAFDLTLAEGTESEVVLEFPSDVVVGGVVIREGSPVMGVVVSFEGDKGRNGAGRTDALGAYEVVGLDPGEYQVGVTGEGVSFATEHVVTASSRLDIDITGGALSGRVVRADGGTPLAGVEISLFRVGKDNRPASSTSTNSQGTFSQRSLREGHYRLVTSKAGFGQEVREVDVPQGGTAEVVFELSPADGVSVTVVDARDGRPLDAIVVVRDAAKRIVANQHSGIGDDGALNIPLTAGWYVLSTSASGYGTVSQPVTAPTRGLRVGLTPGGTLVIESERDLRGRVRLVQPSGEDYVRCECNGIAEIELKGRRTTVENITPGSYTLVLVGQEGSTPQAIVIREGQSSPVRIE